MSIMDNLFRMNPLLLTHVPLCDAIALLLKPQAEVILHDLSTGQVAHVANAFSPRRPGDSSLFDADESFETGSAVIGPYEKMNPDGRRLKSITSVLRDAEGRAYGLICINLDVDVFSSLISQMQALISLPATSAQPAQLFVCDWREGINRLVGDFLNQRRSTLSGLTNEDEDDLLRALESNNVFSIRKAMPYLAELLGWSRTKLYNRMNAIRSKSGGEEL